MLLPAGARLMAESGEILDHLGGKRERPGVAALGIANEDAASRKVQMSEADANRLPNAEAAAIKQAGNDPEARKE